MTIKKGEEIFAKDTHPIIDKLNTLKNKTVSGNDVNKPVKNTEMKVNKDFIPIKDKLNDINNHSKIKKKSDLSCLNNYEEAYAQLFIDCDRIIDELNTNYCSCDCDNCACDCANCACLCDRCSCDCDNCACDCNHTCSCRTYCSCNTDSSGCYCSTHHNDGNPFCFDKNEYIYTINDGVKKISELKTNDQVINGLGDITNVDSNWSIDNITTLYKIKTKNGKQLSMTGNHKLPLFNKEINNEIITDIETIFKYNKLNDFFVKLPPKLNVKKNMDENYNLIINNNLKIDKSLYKILPYIFINSLIFNDNEISITSLKENSNTLFEIGKVFKETLKIHYTIKNNILSIPINNNKRNGISILDIFKSINFNNMFQLINSYNKKNIEDFINIVDNYTYYLDDRKKYEFNMIKEILNDNKYEGILSIEKVSYNDSVFDLTLRNSNTLSLNIVVGDGNLDV